jgi:hypothetical protein
MAGYGLVAAVVGSRQAPRILVSNANVRTIGDFLGRTGAMLA